MTRKEFVRVCALLGIAVPFQSAIYGCSKDEENPETLTNFNGTVLIIGAGPAGMASGYLLAQQGIDFKILEAAPSYGGRIKHHTSFVDFPISLGAEWLHVPRAELTQIVNNPDITITTTTKGYNADDVVGNFNGSYSESTIGQEFGTYIDQKFIGSSWLDFFETYVVPSIESNFIFNTQVSSINYEGAKVSVTDSNGTMYQADKAIVTVPLKMLQKSSIAFTPNLPSSKADAISNATVWGGIKVFIEFSQKFYPVFLTFADSETQQGQRLYYDAAYGQNSGKNVLGLFAVGQQAEQYQNVNGDAQRDFILNELDIVFNGQASQYYVKHMVQNWNEEPFIGAAYLADVSPASIPRKLGTSVNSKLYFAGEAYTNGLDWGSVHSATESARNVVDEIL